MLLDDGAGCSVSALGSSGMVNGVGASSNAPMGVVGDILSIEITSGLETGVEAPAETDSAGVVVASSAGSGPSIVLQLLDE